MEDVHRTILREHTTFLHENVAKPVDLAEQLFQRGIFTPGMKEEVEAATPPKEQMRTILGLLPKTGPKAFYALIDSLLKTNNAHVVDKLTPGWKETQSDVGLPGERVRAVQQPPEDLPEGATTGNATHTMVMQAPPEEMPRYKMDRRPRGVCLIINNRDFLVEETAKISINFERRIGTDHDAGLIESCFTSLGFKIERKNNQTAKQMKNALDEIAVNVDHSPFDCFACFILTHGDDLNNVYGSNEYPIDINYLASPFQANRCKTLAGKPKLFFIQACRGSKKMTGGEVETDGAKTPTPQVLTVPNESDFLYGYATVPGYVSHRNSGSGTWFIQSLCKQLDMYADREDILSILLMVNEEVSREKFDDHGCVYMQTPAPMFTLRKKLFFS